MAKRPLNVTIVGAGLAGLATAISLALETADLPESDRPSIKILESVPSLNVPGAGLQVTPNATRLLSRWGLLDRVEAVCAEPKRLVVHRYDGFPFIDVHRGDLQSLLYERAVELGVKVEWRQRVRNVRFDSLTLSSSQEGPFVHITTESGSSYATDILIGADGIWSKCRELLLGHPDAPQPTGDLAYRIILTLEDLGTDEELLKLVKNPEAHFWTGPGAHCVGYSVRAGASRMYNLVLLCPDDLPDDVARQVGEVSEMKQLFEGWDPILLRFLEKVKKVDKWKLMHRPEMERWGANSALEDGAVLGWCLGKVALAGESSSVQEEKSRGEKIKRAVELYERVRKVRGEQVAKETFLQRHQFHMPDGPEQQERDRIFASQLGKDEIDDSIRFPSRWTCGIAQRWLYGYDAYAAVENAFRDRPL
ncbi:3-hydroxybenzoate 6-hydroxylase [Cyphellophora attinorum]|uniref:3-hydroxybenzoate 6-hydroxylase n=1 Tax=Cyphellophora attinorum TaxID=1664694 RepID=A0A0N1P1K8_9EURO|nr:3-hydroxybenzoate 6-hydroxylase [Phialophora attinorum]KPI42365.1 3-hydroxybenzoate 6-hydroxylase [Phialophora attinorum]